MKWKIKDWTSAYNALRKSVGQEPVAEHTVWNWCERGLLEAKQLPGKVWVVTTPPDKFTPPKMGRPVVEI